MWITKGGREGREGGGPSGLSLCTIAIRVIIDVITTTTKYNDDDDDDNNDDKNKIIQIIGIKPTLVAAVVLTVVMVTITCSNGNYL